MSSDLTLGWPSRRSRRVRSPARPKPQDVTAKTVRRQSAVRPKVAPARQRVSTKHQHSKTYKQLYQEVVQGQRHAAETAPRPLLFGAGNPNTLPSTPALRAKLCPALDTTQNWRRVQHKLLPKYLFVLDAVTAVHLLQCLARLQPPLCSAMTHNAQYIPNGAAPALSTKATARAPSTPSSPLSAEQKASKQHQELLSPPLLQQQQHVHGPTLDQLAELPTSVYGALAGAQAGQWPAPVLTQAQCAAADASAVARGFTSSADERGEFELMLAAVYTVLTPKLTHWPPAVLLKLLGCTGQLHVQHQGFLQALFDATAPHLTQQSGPDLLSCCQAVSRLGVQPPQQWWANWQAAMQDQLSDLSLTQLAALHLHLLHSTQQPSGSWWCQLHAAALDKVGASSQHLQGHQRSLNTYTAATAADGGSGSSTRQTQEVLAADNGPGVVPSAAGLETLSAADVSAAAAGAATAAQAGTLAVAGGALTVTEADVLCTLLCTCHFCSSSSSSSRRQVTQSWLPVGLQLCLRACQQGRLSTAGALQLLSACCFGACRQLPQAAAARQVCLDLLQERMAKLPSPTGVAVLFACLLTQSGESGPHPSFAEALGKRLVEVLPVLPTVVLCQVPHVLAAIGWQGPDERLVASFALVSQAEQRLEELGWEELEVLVEGCHTLGLSMPPFWCSAVHSRLADVAAGLQQQRIPAVGAPWPTSGPVTLADLLHAMQGMRTVINKV